MNTLQLPTCPKCGLPLPVDAPKGLCPRCLGTMNLADETAFTGADAVAAQTPLTPSELAPHFPQLEILECLGRGGMGVVYKARQKSLNRFVALKLLAPERESDPSFAERFAKEAQALAALNHPHIVGVYDFGEAGGFYFLLMEFVDGVNLRQAMKAGRFTPEQALAVVPPVCEALQFAHEHGIVHRDIKPENLLLDKDGRVKIADFGIAKMLGAAAYQPPKDAAPAPGTAADKPPLPENDTFHSAAGTPQYMAPEQKAHRATDHRADIYSLGVVLYELLTGELPADKLQPPSRKVQIDVRLDEIVLRALEAKPELRYQTAADFRTQLETVATPGGGRREEAQTSPAPAPLLKTASAYLSTPKRLASLFGKLSIYSCKGTLVLTQNQLGFTDARTGAPITIPLTAIRDVSLCNYPWFAKPVPLHYISVTWVEGGFTRLHYFTPNGGWFMPVWETNPIVREWHAGLRAAVTAATGKVPDETPAPPHRPTAGDLGWMVLMFGLPMCLIGAVLLHFQRMMGAPESLWQSGWFLISAVFAVIGLVRLMRRLMMGGSSSSASQEASEAPGASDGMTKRQSRWQGWEVWVIGLCLATFGALWLLRLSDERLIHRPLYDGAGAGSSVVLPIALATTILLAGAAFLWMLAKNIGTPASRAASSKRLLGRTIVPVIALVVLLRTFFVQSFEAATDAAAPEIPRGSYMLTWKLAREFAPGDLMVYRHENRPNVGRVTRSEPAAVIVERNGSADFRVPRQNISGKVISVLWRASVPSGVTQFDIVPVGVSNNVVIVDVTTEVRRGNAELRAVLDGPELSATTEAAVADKFSPPFTGTFVKPMQDRAKQPSRSLSPGRQTWRLGFVLPDAALAKEAFEDIRPIGPLPAVADRDFVGTLFEVRDANGQEFHATLHVALPITPADPNWVSVSSAPSTPDASALSSYNESAGVIMNWEVLASQPGIVSLHREGGQSTASLRRDPKTKLYQVAVSLELTQAGADRVLLASRIGSTTAREELPGNLRELSAELWSYKNLSSTTVRGTEIELCRFQGKPIKVLVPVLISTVTSSATATGPAIQRVEISPDKAVVHTAHYDGSGLLITLGTGTNRWTPSGRYLDGLFNVTLEWPSIKSGARHVIQPRHGIHFNYRLDGPPGPMLGKLVFRSGSALPDAGGSCVIGAFQSDTGEPLPIAVEFVPDQATPTLPAPVEVHRAVGVGWLSLIVLLGVVVVGGVGVAVLLVVVLRKRGAGAGKILAVLAAVVVLLFLLIVGAAFLIYFKSHRTATQAEVARVEATRAEKQALASHTAEVMKRQSAQASQPSSAAAGPEIEQGINGPLSVTLPNGVTVGLVGLSDYPTRNKPWWLPSGEACQPLFDASAVDLRSVQPVGERTVVCAFAITGLKSGTGSEVGFVWPEFAMWGGRQFKNGVLQPEIKAVALNVATNASLVHLRLTLDPAERFRLEYETRSDTSVQPNPVRLPLAEVGVAFRNVALRPGLRAQPSAVLLGAQRGGAANPLAPKIAK